MSTHLEKTYSREQQRLGNELEIPPTPHPLVRSISQAEVGEESARIRVNEEDVDAQLELEKEDDLKETEESSPAQSSTGSGQQAPPRRIIRFEDGDSAQPNNWNQGKKIYALSTAILTVMNSTVSSSLAAGATTQISHHFHNTNEYQLILPTSIFLVGYTCGPLIWGPLSESYGRKWTKIVAFALFTIFSIASALSPNFTALILFRLFTGIGGSAAISIVGGICADIYHDPRSRGIIQVHMAIFMAATTFGPILGPPISGFSAPVSWSWPFWIGAIFAGASWPVVLCFPETYAPIILKHRARRLRKETGDMSIVAPIELEKTDFHHIMVVVLTRPLRMICFEPLVLFTCLYLSYAYAIFYIFFQSYPIIFIQIYSFNPGEEGLAFLPIGIGALISAALYLLWDKILFRAQTLSRPWSQSEEMRRLPLACIAGPFFVLSLFWAGWTAKQEIHWIVPVLAGIPFGIGYLCLFMALLNYLVDAYEIFAASAMAAASFSRSSFGAVLPFAAKPMYRTLGVPWACSLLGFFSLAMCAIPFVFIRFGTSLRKKSKFCQYLAQKKREEVEAREREADGRDPEDVEAAGRRIGGTEGDDKC
ncbi:MFS general substrate transporter [Lindgomyces ingoldianus]|uniref:MFS general substrate transporter n=1 Tax=Lindgomyces ingoldianus TaxID=673940 RepID=A0ACB6QHH8_9PLEO|nr:MFS general substrate transporter [Lindgomyces ingoldianus]KAF2466389.1 MFS general substrate transporter [Lindgomyces ingoldianus]